MDDLIRLARLPIARLPKASLGQWFDFIRGKADLRGQPIPQGELDVPDIWRPVIARLGAPRATMAAEDFLNWLYRQAQTDNKGALAPGDPEAADALLAAHDSLSAVFCHYGELIDFRDEIPSKDRAALCRHVQKYYRPLIKR